MNSTVGAAQQQAPGGDWARTNSELSISNYGGGGAGGTYQYQHLQNQILRVADLETPCSFVSQSRTGGRRSKNQQHQSLCTATPQPFEKENNNSLSGDEASILQVA